MTKKGSYLLLLIGLSVANIVNGDTGRMNILDKNRELVVRYFDEIWNKGNLNSLAEIISEDYINHNPGFENPAPGPKGLRPIVQAIRDGFPDLNYTIQNMVVSEEQVSVHVLMTGTHTGHLFGIPPTGKVVSVDQMQIERIANGKIVEHWRVTDDLQMMKQLGLSE